MLQHIFAEEEELLFLLLPLSLSKYFQESPPPPPPPGNNDVEVIHHDCICCYCNGSRHPLSQRSFSHWSKNLSTTKLHYISIGVLYKWSNPPGIVCLNYHHLLTSSPLSTKYLIYPHSSSSSTSSFITQFISTHYVNISTANHQLFWNIDNLWSPW